MIDQSHNIAMCEVRKMTKSAEYRGEALALIAVQRLLSAAYKASQEGSYRGSCAAAVGMIEDVEAVLAKAKASLSIAEKTEESE